MEYSKQNNPHSPFFTFTHSLPQERSEFFKKVRLFLGSASAIQQRTVRVIRGGFGFALVSPITQWNTIENMFEESFGFNVQEFTRVASRFGFTIRSPSKPPHNQKVILFLSKQKLLQVVREHSRQLWQQSLEEDQFPKEQEVDAVMKQKQQRSKFNLVKSNFILNKALSQGNIGLEKTKKDDASIEVKLLEQDVYLTPFSGTIKYQNIKGEIGVRLNDLCPLSLVERTRMQKQNYEKCSKLIDGTIIELLQAHKSNCVQERKELLMEKVVEIYDLLSNGIENTGSIRKMFTDRESSKSEERSYD